LSRAFAGGILLPTYQSMDSTSQQHGKLENIITAGGGTSERTTRTFQIMVLLFFLDRRHFMYTFNVRGMVVGFRT